MSGVRDYRRFVERRTEIEGATGEESGNKRKPEML